MEQNGGVKRQEKKTNKKVKKRKEFLNLRCIISGKNFFNIF